ncbi:MBL fold metallo-hydrolase [Nocardia beijingensis]
MKTEQVSDADYAAAGTNVNWALISDGSGVTFIDAGYPADTDDVLASITQIGHQLRDVAAVLITHATSTTSAPFPPFSHGSACRSTPAAKRSITPDASTCNR